MGADQWGGGGGAVHFRPIQPVGRGEGAVHLWLSIFENQEGALYLHGYIGNQIASCTL